MDYQIKDFSAKHINAAVDLFLQSYKHEKERNTLLPEDIITDPQLILSSLNANVQNTGVAAFSNNRLIGYMLTRSPFSFKNQKAVMVPEYGHSSIDKDRHELYKLMYMNLSSKWIQQNIHLHIIGHFAHDEELSDLLFKLGFGAILSEKLRDLSPITNNPDILVQTTSNQELLVDLELEHRQYYQKAPIFIKKNTDRDTIRSDLMNHHENGDVFLVVSVNDVPAGYFCIGTSTKDGEGFLLQDTNTAQIKSAYITSSFRRKGMGTALLNETVNWARSNSFNRLFVEHETANYSGGKFWEKHFTPYLYYSIRYMDNSIE
jgi:GNAT superfamily N-acetyltransferase